MESTSLRRAYAAYLDAVQTVIAAGSDATPPPGEWDCDQQLAHVVAVDAAVLAAAYCVAAGAHATFDNRRGLDPWSLARTIERVGDRLRLRERIGVQGEALCALAEQLGDDELGELIPTLLLSGDTAQVDQPVRLRDLISGLADDHLPRHTAQLLELVPQAAEPTVE